MFTHRSSIEGANEGIAIAIFSGGDWGFGFDHGVDSSHCGVQHGQYNEGFQGAAYLDWQPQSRLRIAGDS